MIWNIVSQDLQSTFYTGTRGHSCLSRTTQVCIIKVCQTVRSRPNFLTSTLLAPRLEGVLSPHTLQKPGYSLAIADHNTIHSANLTRFSNNFQTPGRSHKSKRCFRPRACKFDC